MARAYTLAVSKTKRAVDVAERIKDCSRGRPLEKRSATIFHSRRIALNPGVTTTKLAARGIEERAASVPPDAVPLVPVPHSVCASSQSVSPSMRDWLTRTLRLSQDTKIHELANE